VVEKLEIPGGYKYSFVGGPLDGQSRVDKYYIGGSQMITFDKTKPWYEQEQFWYAKVYGNKEYGEYHYVPEYRQNKNNTSVGEFPKFLGEKPSGTKI